MKKTFFSSCFSYTWFPILDYTVFGVTVQTNLNSVRFEEFKILTLCECRTHANLVRFGEFKIHLTLCVSVELIIFDMV